MNIEEFTLHGIDNVIGKVEELVVNGFSYVQGSARQRGGSFYFQFSETNVFEEFANEDPVVEIAVSAPVEEIPVEITIPDELQGSNEATLEESGTSVPYVEKDSLESLTEDYLDSMTKKEIAEYAKENFEMEVSTGQSKKAMIEEILGRGEE